MSKKNTTTEVEQADSSGYKILVVEEDHFLRERISGILSRLPEVHTVTQMARNDEMLESVIEMCPDIILFDLALCNRNKTVAGKIRQEFPQTLIFCITNYPVSGNEAEELKAGVDGFIFKSDIVNELRSAMKKH